MTNIIVEGGPDRVSVVVPPSSIKVSYDVGRTGRRGSIWFSGSGAPGPLTLPEVELFVNDMYMDSVSGWIWQYILLPNNTADWVKAYQASAGGGGAVSSVAGRTGDVTLTVSDLTDAASLATDAELTAGLATKANTSHLHTSANITDWDEAVQDTVAAMLVSGANVTLAYDDVAGKVVITAAGGDAEVMRDTIGAALVGVGGVSIAVNDAADTITLSISGVTSTQISDSTATGRSVLTAADAAAARAAIGAGTSSLAIGTTGTTAAAGNRQATATAIGMVELATTAETTTGTDTTRAVTPAGLKAVADTKATALGADDNYVTDSEKTKLANLSGVNTGDQDLSGYVQTTNAPELIRDTIGSTLVAGSNVTITPDDANDTITIAASGGGGGLSYLAIAPTPIGDYLPLRVVGGHSSSTTIGTTTQNSRTAVALTPIETASPCTVDRFGVHVSTPATDAGAVLAAALYSTQGDLIADIGVVDITGSAGIRELVLPQPISIPQPGVYFIALKMNSDTTDGTNPKFFGTQTALMAISTELSSNNHFRYPYSGSSINAPWPSTLNFIIGSTSSAPTVIRASLRRAS